MIPIPKKMSKCLTAGNAERAGLLVKGEEGEEHGAGADQGHPAVQYGDDQGDLGDRGDDQGHPAIQYHGDDQGDLDERGDDQGHPAIQEW